MPIFQKSIVDKYIATLDVDTIDKAFESYKHIYSAQKIQRIKKLKEEQYQGGFLKDIFGSVLGYTIDPEIGYNLELEKKNETNSKKADGAILKDEKVLGVIELKSNTTKNLESIKDQAFGYKNNHKGCKYVVSSNFHKLRFYVDDATEYEEFDLYNLDKETFKRFYLFRRKEGLLDKNIPKLLKDETKFHEENISKQLYKDYSTFKNKFFENIVKNNPRYDKLLLFKKSQKFLDRILFVLFAEDKELIPTNAISKIVENWALADDLQYKPLYEIFTILFEHLNVGHIYKSGYEIPAYNGGLFAPDEVLDNLKVDDEILKDDLLILSKYDFNTDVDVNILGHIFEHSLSEIEEIEAELKGEDVDRSKGKRKKDGVFYTPKYITKYIVDNTVGKLCSEKKDEFGLDIDFDVQEYQKSDGSVNQKGRKLFHTLESYKEWLLTLKILDPACGSGAFLNQALSFLIEEHKNIDDLIAELTNSPLRIFDTDKVILENNIFGVDINDESVEIAKLSLWLRTAQKGRKLSNLNNNIKCGNSLIDDSSVAGEKAFKWEEEFPEIFNHGGFDVVIGNPPYVSSKGENFSAKEKNFFLNTYQCAVYQIDLYLLFKEKSLALSNEDGIISLIEPNAWMNNLFLKNIRKFLLDKTTIHEIVNTPIGVFHDATVDTVILTYSKKKENFNSIKISEANGGEINFIHNKNPEEFLNNENFDFDILVSAEEKKILQRIEFNTASLIDITIASSGIKEYEVGKGTPPQSKVTIREKPFNTRIKLNETYRKHITGSDISHYILNWQGGYLKYGKCIAAPRNPTFFEGSRLIVREIPSKKGLVVSYTDEPYTVKNTAHVFKVRNPEYSIFGLLAILNSRLMGFYFKKKFSEDDDVFPKAKLGQCKKLPINVNLKNNPKFDLSVAQLIQSLDKFSIINSSLLSLLNSKYAIDKPSKKLQKWHELDFGEFLKELDKACKKSSKENEMEHKKLSLADESEWLQYFSVQKENALTLKIDCDKTANEIDVMVYQLYGLTEAEIELIENS